MPGEWRGVTSASRVFGGASYEISDDLRRLNVEAITKRYGGSHRAHGAATIIQRAYRQYRMNSRFKQITSDFSHLSRNSNGFSTPDRARYAPTTSLSAQLRADRTTISAANDTRSRTRSPPSPSPRGRQEYSMLDSLMSPRLATRRVPHSMSSHPLHASQHTAGLQSHFSASSLSMSPSTMHSASPSVSNDRPPISNGYAGPNLQGAHTGTVWVPRTNGTFHISAMHCNSLPRLEKKQRRMDENSFASRRPNEIERKREYRIALNFFNKKPERGVQLLIAWRFVEENPENVAKLLFGRRGLSKVMIGEYLGVLRSPFNSCVLEYFLAEVDIRGLEVDMALRKCLHYFWLPGESQKIERIMETFSIHYSRCNQSRVSRFHGGHKTVFILAYAIIMLNTDLHNRNLKPSERMKKDQFVTNLRGVDDGANIDRDVLSEIYDRIKQDEFRTGDDHVAQVTRVDNAIIGQGKPRLPESHRRLVCYCRLNQIMDITKKQASTSHEREVFLFNDMIVITKSTGTRRRSPTQQYTLKAFSPLLGARVDVFSRGTYDFGILLITPDQQRLNLNARNHDDRCRFVSDVRESILECQGMDQVRLDLEMERVSLRTDCQRDSGLPDAEVGEEGAIQQQEHNPGSRRHSGHSLDSGVVEEGYDVHAH